MPGAPTSDRICQRHSVQWSGAAETAIICHNWPSDRHQFDTFGGQNHPWNQPVDTQIHLMQTQTSSSHRNPAPIEAHDIEIAPGETEYREVVACLPARGNQGCRILKVIRHQIPAALFNGGGGCRISWSVLADAGHGERVHYTIYNRQARSERVGIAHLSRMLKRSRYYLGGCRHC